MYDVYDVQSGIRHATGCSLWGALAMCRDLNARNRTPGRFAPRKTP